MPHIHYAVDFTVEVFIVYKNKVLLRKHDKYKVWLSVGGHIELNEEPNEAAVREVREEVGLEVQLDATLLANRPEDDTKELIPPYYLNCNRVGEFHRHVTFVYFARAKSDKIEQTIKRERVKDCRWFTKEEIEKNTELKPNVRFYALEALKKLSESV